MNSKFLLAFFSLISWLSVFGQFSRENISYDILTRFQKQIPHVYQLMQNFNQNNTKAKHLSDENKI